MPAQDELIGFSGREEWSGYTAALDKDALYAAGEDAQVGGPSCALPADEQPAHAMAPPDPDPCSSFFQGRATYRPRALFVDLSGSLGSGYKTQEQACCHHPAS